MIMRTALLMLLIISSLTLIAKDAPFSFQVPGSLKENANAVVLFHNVTYQRLSKSELKQNVHYALTLLSERANKHSNITLGYDNFTSVSNIACTVYDAKGEKVRKIKNSEISDYAAYDGFSLLIDNRIKRFSALHPTYPYTIEVSYEIVYRGFLQLPTWAPVQGYNVSVKESSVLLKYPNDIPVLFKEKNCAGIAREEFSEGALKCIKWKADSMKAIEYERFSPSFRDLVPSVLFSPQQFAYDKSEGMFDSWGSLGLWNYGLLEKQYELSAKTQQDLDLIKSKNQDKRELIRQVYKYMQSKTRYVSIQLGIGGYKPFSPGLVDKVGYGDCKALSYYTKALLEYVGVPSVYAIIGANDNKIELLDFPCISQINHAILCVPMAEDSIWLECTSQTAPFNHLFNGSAGRTALLIKSDGGELVKTNDSPTNRLKSQALLNLNSNGEINCGITSRGTGMFYDDDSDKLYLSNKELRESLLEESKISDIVLQNAVVSHVEEIPEIIINKQFLAKNLVSRSGNRCFVELSPFTGLRKINVQRGERQNPVEIDQTFVYEDNITLSIPEGFSVEFCPEGKTIESGYGSYQSETEVQKEKIIFSRTFMINRAVYKKEEYRPFVAFLNSAAEADQCKVVFSKTSEAAP
jgi:hypothetical protein